ncbi:MAG: carbonic anhydrase [Glaciecola sp.]|jgi:carbonic anhydrase
MNYLKSILVIAIAGVLITACEKEEVKVERHYPHWNYESPIWQDLGYTDCGGVVQTPINIETEHTIKSTDLSNVTFNYSVFDIKIVDNGHTVQVNHDAAKTNNMFIDGVTYDFLQFHYHTHSEHEIDGEPDEMEIHLVHQDPITENLAVVGVMLNANGTTPNDFIESYLESFPSTQNKEVATTTSIDLNDLLPSNHNYYTYTGSLTTPPCSQGLKWILLKDKVDVSEEQIHIFEERHHVNARPIQPLNGRIVLEKI